MVDQIDNSQRGSALLLEEETLGAQFEQYGDIWTPQSFGNDEELHAAKAGLIDLTACGVIQITGKDSTLFLQTLSTGSLLPTAEDDGSFTKGETVPSHAGQSRSDLEHDHELLLTQGLGRAVKALFLTAEAEIIDLTVILEMGENSFTLICSPENKDELFEWLQAHAQLEQEGVKAFDDVTLADLTGALTLIALYGDKTGDILSDYLPELPATFNAHKSQVKPVLFDGKIPVILTHIHCGEHCKSTSEPLGVQPFTDDLHASHLDISSGYLNEDVTQVPSLYLMFIAPEHSTLLYRSLLSFHSVIPFGFDALRMHLMNSLLPGYPSLFEGAYVSVNKLMSLHRFIRKDHGFVGGKYIDL